MNNTVDYYNRNKSLLLLKRKENRNNNPIRERAQTIIDSHKRKGLKVIITKDELISLLEKTNVCSICGASLIKTYGHGKIKPNSLSLDRINNEIELRIDNVQVVCYKCNTTKGTRTMNAFIDYCKNVYMKFGDNNE